MHIYFSAIGGAGIGALAQIALQAGYTVSGSDKQDSAYIHYLREHGISDIHIGQTREAIAAVHEAEPIDWFVYSSAVTLENPDSPEIAYCEEQAIRTSKRDELLNVILVDKQLKLIAIAGTHGKTTTTALSVWLCKELGLPVSYLLPAKTSFADMGEYDIASEYFIYEADEFDRNFLAYQPHLSLITGVSWDHHEIFPTREDYQAAFREFIDQSVHTFIWQEDAAYLELEPSSNIAVLDNKQSSIAAITLKGLYNRLDAWLAVQGVASLTRQPIEDLIAIVNRFPGVSRRMEQIKPNLFTDYAHTPEKIRGALAVAQDMVAETNQPIVIVYEPLTNRRQLHIMDNYKDCFSGASNVYWLPSYLAREDPKDRIVPPEELISHLDDPTIAVPMERSKNLKAAIQKHLDDGAMVIGLAGGGGDSLDDWLRQEFASD